MHYNKIYNLLTISLDFSIFMDLSLEPAVLTVRLRVLAQKLSGKPLTIVEMETKPEIFYLLMI